MNPQDSILVADTLTVVADSLLATQIPYDLKAVIKLVLTKVGVAALILFVVRLALRVVQYGYNRAIQYVTLHKERWLKTLSYKDYTILTAEQELQGIYVVLKVAKWFVYALVLYLSIPFFFILFPVTRGWADVLFSWIWTPFRSIFVSIWEYLPDLFTILVILMVVRYAMRFVRYVFTEIEEERLQFSGFHTDWAQPTYHIVRFLLYAFTFVMIFPYLPGSDSEIFKGVSVFLGILFSLGSSTAISNMVAGLVITYMRPFQLGDRIRIGSVTGDVVEKTMLVTRIRTIKNEEVTIPNASVLSGNTTNFSTLAATEGLIVHTTVTIGYDVPWKTVHEALLEAARRTSFLLAEPKPFVLQTALDDFYVAYQVNGYTREANKQAAVYSELHQHIQDACNEAGIEILSPHYRAARDGNATTIPASYLPEGYAPPAFQVQHRPPPAV